jgi:hypothetical protein
VSVGCVTFPPCRARSRNSDANAVITALLNLLFLSLAHSKTDPGAWIERRQAQLRKAASDGA